MNYQQYFNSMKEIKEGQEKLRLLELDVKNEAYNEGLFHFELKELVDEINACTGIVYNRYNVSFDKKVPSFINNIEQAKDYFKNYTVYATTFLPTAFGIYLSTLVKPDTKLSDGTKIWDHMHLSKGKNADGMRLLEIDEDAKDKIMVYLPPETPIYRKPAVETAIQNIIKHKIKTKK